MFEWLTVLDIQFFIFGSVKNVYKTFSQQKNGQCWKLSLRIFLTLLTLPNYLFVGFKTIILCSVYPPLKVEVLSNPSLFENLIGSTPPAEWGRGRGRGKGGGGAHYQHSSMGVFSRFLNSTNGTKSGTASHI